MSIVIDASIALAWAFPDEQSEIADDVMYGVMENGGIVPCHWMLELSNSLVMNERKGRVRTEERTGILEDLKSIPVTVDSETGTRAFAESAELARRHRISVYDAAYLELARRVKLSLATVDEELAKAAKVEGIPLAVLKD